MFRDYYKILDIPFDHPQSEIKKAFKAQATKWHPDKNLGIDSTERMQNINEAYLILNDIEARGLYDLEYVRFKDFSGQKQSDESACSNDPYSEKSTSFDFEINDEKLKRWIINARKQAAEYVKQTLKEVGELSVTATKAAASSMLELVIWYSVFGLVVLILMKACGEL